MKKAHILTASVVGGLAIVGGAVFWQRTPPTSPAITHVVAPEQSPCYRVDGSAWDFTESRVIIGGKQIAVAVADEPQERLAGLGGCRDLAPGVGMYFVFDPIVATSFWMKGMVMPIDIIWIADGVVVDIDHNVMPQPGVVDAALTTYDAGQAISAVLEVAAGQAAAQGITIGARVGGK